MTQSPFQRALGPDFAKLPAALQCFHSSDPPYRFHGRARVEHGRGILPAIAIKSGGFPPQTTDTAITITVTPSSVSETWERMFGTHKTTSELRYDTAESAIIERFGTLTCTLVPALNDGVLNVAVVRASVLGIPLPRFISPRSESREWQDEQGRFCFDIAAYLGRDRLLVRYSGWLEPTLRTTS